MRQTMKVGQTAMSCGLFDNWHIHQNGKVKEFSLQIHDRILIIYEP